MRVRKQKAFISYIVLTIIAVIVVSAGVYVTAQNSIPGDPLYSVKEKIDQLESSLK
jgi:hypothetical protein